MSTRSKRQKSRTSRATGKSKSRRRRRSSGGVDPLVWIVAIIVAIVALLVVNTWQSGAFAKPPGPSRSADPVDLLPLADAGVMLRGGHNMALIPQQTPAPRAVPAGASAPQLSIPSADHDFGEVYAQWDVTHVFAIQNTGDENLIISNLVTSCGCTVAELSSSVIPPGQRADLTVAFDANFHETNGPVTRLVWFGTNDPAHPWGEVRILADVK